MGLPMSLRNIAFAFASASLMAAPVAAQAAEAAPVQRSAAPTAESNKLFGGTELWVFAAITVILLAWYALDNDRHNDPVSS